MERTSLGTTGIQVSRYCLGAMMFGAWGNRDHDDSIKIIHTALDAGINFIDTADVYAGGASETITGAAIAPRRSRWILATKVGNVMPGDENRRPHTGGLSRRWIMQACDASLARLRTDFIDVYYLHIDDAQTPLAETVAAMGALIAAGKIRYFGVSNFRGWRIAQIVETTRRLGVPQPIVCQPLYNAMTRGIEVDYTSACNPLACLGPVPEHHLVDRLLATEIDLPPRLRIFVRVVGH